MCRIYNTSAVSTHAITNALIMRFTIGKIEDAKASPQIITSPAIIGL
jgi:hypothetical protein